MATPLITVFAIVLVMIILVVVVAKLARDHARKQKDLMTRFSGQSGLELIDQEPVSRHRWLSWMRKAPELKGTRKGQPIRLFTYSRSAGKSQIAYVALRMGVSAPDNWKFQFNAEGIFSKLGKSLGMREIESGDERFDKVFVIKSKSPDLVKAILIPEIKEQFYVAWEERGAQGILKLKDGELQYDEVGSLNSEKMLRRFLAMLELMRLLAEAVETYAEAKGESPRS